MASYTEASENLTAEATKNSTAHGSLRKICHPWISPQRNARRLPQNTPRSAAPFDETHTAARDAVCIAEPGVARVRPDGAESRGALAHPDARHAPVGTARAQQIESVLLKQPFRMLRGDGETLFKRERQTFVGFDELARHVGLAVRITGAGVRFDDQIERPSGGSNPSVGRKLTMSRGGMVVKPAMRSMLVRAISDSGVTSSRVGTSSISAPRSLRSSARMSGRASARKASSLMSATSG